MSKADDIRKATETQHEDAIENIRSLSDRVLGEEAARMLGGPGSGPHPGGNDTPLEREVSDASHALKQFPRGPTGMVSDAVRLSPEYKAAKQRYAVAFAKLRSINSQKAK